MTVRMELAAALHHSASKSAGPESNDASRSQKTVNSREVAVFFKLYDEDTAGWRPPCLGESPVEKWINSRRKKPQERKTSGILHYSESDGGRI